MNALLEKALGALTLRIQMTSGKLLVSLSNPDDKSATIELLEKISAHGISLEPAEVGNWAINNGWPRSAAGELGNFAALAASIPDPKTKPDSTFWHEDILTTLESDDSAFNALRYPATDKCKECSLRNSRTPGAEGCLMEIMKAQWAEPYWLTQCCITPEARQLAGLVNGPPAIPI